MTEELPLSGRELFRATGPSFLRVNCNFGFCYCFYEGGGVIWNWVTGDAPVNQFWLVLLVDVPCKKGSEISHNLSALYFQSHLSSRAVLVTCL